MGVSELTFFKQSLCRILFRVGLNLGFVLNCTLLTFSHSWGVSERSFCIHCIPSSELIIKQFK